MWPDPITAALERTEGALYRKCALQVNPSHYRETYRGEDTTEEEEDYIEELLDTAERENISVMGVTDHNHVGAVGEIAREAEKRGITVFPGFEASSQEGVHILCLFEPGTSQETLERYLGDLGIHDTDPNPELSKKTFKEVCRFVDENDGLAIAAHVTNNKGLLKTLDGQACIRAWRTPELLAAQIPGAISDLPMKYRQIVENDNPEYERKSPPAPEQAIAVLNAKDVTKPDDLEDQAASCMVKMTEPTIEAMRQACLDPGSRIRLHSDPEPPERARLLAMGWEGGFLDGVRIHFNRNLNVLIGGKGTGKSTIIESIRYALDLRPDGADAEKNHEQIISDVVQSGTKITLLVYSPTPSPKRYLIKRTVPNPPQVLDIDGNLLDFPPKEVIGDIEIYGQHEIGELTRDPQTLSILLDRFVDGLGKIQRGKKEMLRDLERNRSDIIERIEERKRIKSQLGELPALEEELSRFREAGVEEKLKEKSELIEEEAAFDEAEELFDGLESTVSDAQKEISVDLEFVAEKKIGELGGAEHLGEVRSILDDLRSELEVQFEKAGKAVEEARNEFDSRRGDWREERKQPVNERHAKLLRELDRESVEGDTFVELKERAEELRPKEKQLDKQEDKLEELRDKRRELTDSWEELHREEFKARVEGAEFVNQRLDEQVRVEVVYSGDRDPVVELLRSEVGGRLHEAVEAIREREEFSLPSFVDSCRSGEDELEDEYGKMTAHQASSIVESGEDIFMRLEELELPHTVQISLNVAAEGDEPVWRSMRQLSAGQKATAALLLLLLESDSPLVIDQPEDDLDNRFIAEGIVPRMRDEKTRRQFVFSTHNANLPVLGDAELILGLSAEGEATAGKAKIPVDRMGSIDVPNIQLLVEEVLEGGKSAFETRRKKYGF